MSPFQGFSSGEQDMVHIPSVFFTDVLPLVDDLYELRVTLHVFWSLEGQNAEPRFVRFSDMAADERLIKGFGEKAEERETNLMAALDKAVMRGTLVAGKRQDASFYFLNSARGVAAKTGLESGAWDPENREGSTARLRPERPNIFKLYEQNIGPLTPILAETLQDAEKIYPADWIEEAIKIAVTRNARNWRFVEAVLKSWHEKGRDETDRRPNQEDRKRDSQGKYGDFVKH